MRAPFPTRFGRHGMVSSIDDLASGAGLEMLKAGGSAADAAVAASAVLAVTSQPMCGIGGDLLAVVHPGGEQPVLPIALNASGKAGSGADADRLIVEGSSYMPYAEDIRCVPVPGCVDGWAALHDRFGKLALSHVLEPARSYAVDGFPASPLLAALSTDVAHVKDAPEFSASFNPGELVRHPGVGRVLDQVARDGREGFYMGEAGAALVELGGGEFAPEDMERCHAEWVPALSTEAFGHVLWTVPPNSQGYLALASAWIAAGLELPDDPQDPLWAHLLIESARQAAFDRLDVLHEQADGEALLAPSRLAPRREAIRADRASALGGSYGRGDTVGLCAVDERGMGVSLLQSLATVWGSKLAIPGFGIFLHNRGTGFSLEPGHPARYGRGRRPPHTLSPALATRPDGSLRATVATMGGDSQPQILLQTLTRLLHNSEDPGTAIGAGRFALRSTAKGWDLFFGTWGARGSVKVAVEGHAPEAWQQGLTSRGHEVAPTPAFSDEFGHAHLIDVREGVLAGAADPRPRAGIAAAW